VRPRPAPRRFTDVGPAPATYVPEPYDPRDAGTPDAPAAHIDGSTLALLMAQHGAVYPAQRRGRGGVVTLLVVLALAAGFFGWRTLRGSDSGSARHVAYTSAAGHFRAQFPEQPSEVSIVQRLGRNTLSVHGAGVPQQLAVLEADIAGPLPRHPLGLATGMESNVDSGAGITRIRMRSLTFAGHPARQVECLDQDGTPLTLLFVVYGPRRLYLLFGPTGGDFEALRDSFVATA
jgi:hypothetical protein